MKNNYYDILGVTPDSDETEIKKSYRRLARKYHPDINPQAIGKFKDINEAYSTLSNEKKRMQYDMLFGFYRKSKPEVNKKETSYSEEISSKSKSSETDNSPKVSSEKAETKKEKPFFEDLFSTSKEKNAKIKGSDIITEVSISIPEAQNGTSKVVNIVHTELCTRCKGRKFINGSTCSDCGGTGEVTRKRKLTVKIPAGIKNETKLRLIGEGNKGLNGGENGDLYITVKIENTSNVKFSGKIMLCDVPILPYEAVLGGVIKIQTLYGVLNVKIPPRTKSGQKFRIKQNVNGFENEIIVTVHIEIPSYLSEDEIKLYEKLKKVSSCDIRGIFENV